MKLTTAQKMAAARVLQLPVLGARRAISKGPCARVRRRGVNWELDLREGIDFSIWLRGYFEPSTVAAYRRLTSSGSTVLDIGANVGAHTLHLARAVGNGGRVIAFEPSERAFRQLRRNVELNPILGERILLRQTMLLGSDDAALPDSVISSWPLLPRHDLDPTIPGRALPTTGARASTLDTALRSEAVGTVGLVKLDVDGYECEVLDGASKTLAEYRPVILIELAPFVFEAAGSTIDALTERLSSYDYRLFTLRGNHEVTQSDIARLTDQQASMNVVAHHRDAQTWPRRQVVSPGC